MFERWRDVPGWAGKYQVSDRGRVRSYMTKSGARVGTPHLLKPQSLRNGYLQIRFWDAGKVFPDLVHRVVLSAFMGSPGVGQVACHGNGIKTDNRIENLRWDSIRANHLDKRRHGTFQEGVKHGMSKLNDAAVRLIRASSETQAALAERFGVSDVCISQVQKRRTWRHV